MHNNEGLMLCPLKSAATKKTRYTTGPFSGRLWTIEEALFD
jgi:hypothetical protein